MTEQHTTTVLLVDDHPLMRRGLRALLESEADIAVAGEAGDGQEAIDQVKILARVRLTCETPQASSIISSPVSMGHARLPEPHVICVEMS